MTTTVTPPPAEVWIEHIQKNLPDDLRLRTIIARVLVLFLGARDLSDLELLPIQFFDQLKVTWPTPIMRIELSHIACGFFGLDNATAAPIREYLQKLLDEGDSKDSLQAYCAAMFGATCERRYDRMPTIGENPNLMRIHLASTLSVADALEDFAVRVDEEISDRRVVDAVCAYYNLRGGKTQTRGSWFTFTHFILVEGIGRRLIVKISNFSTLGRVLVTVIER